MMKEWWDGLKLMVFKIISLAESRPKANFVRVHYINLTLINKWMIKEW